MRQYLVILVALAVVIPIVWSFPNTSGLYRILSVLNAIIATFFMFTYRGRPYSLHKIVNLFILFFFIIANAIQFSSKTNVTTFPDSVCANDIIDYERFQILVMFILICFNLFYPIFKNLKSAVDNKKPQLSSNKLLLVAIFSLFCTLYYFRNGILLMFVRGLAENQEGVEVLNLGEGFVGFLLFDKLIRALPFACFVLAAHYKQPKKIQILLLFLMLITLFPTALARNATAMYWMPVFFLTFKILEKENIFVLSMLFGLLVVFPFLDNFRYWTGDLTSVGLSFDFLNEMHFDASQDFMTVMKLQKVTWGNQLLGALLFWVPRSLWASKPIGSGAFAAEQYSDFGNISMPWFAEGYINFGYVGIFVFTFFLSWFCSYFDSKYWDNKRAFSFVAPYYFLLISSLMYILRGDLMSSMAYTLATLFDIFVVYKMVKFTNVTEETKTNL